MPRRKQCASSVASRRGYVEARRDGLARMEDQLEHPKEVDGCVVELNVDPEKLKCVEVVTSMEPSKYPSQLCLSVRSFVVVR